MFNRNNRNNRNRKKIMALILAASMVLSNLNIPVVSTALDLDSVVYASDIKDLQKRLDNIWEGTRNIMQKFAAIE